MTGASVSHISGGWGSRATSSPSCREAVLRALGGDRALMARFARACSEGVPALIELGQPVRRALQERGHGFETHGEQLEETVSVLHDVAFKLMPASPGAALGRMRRRVRERAGEPRSAVEAIEALVIIDDGYLNDVLRAATSGDDEYTMAVARNVHFELKRRGRRWEPGDFSQHLRAVMIELHSAYREHWIAWCADERYRAIVYVCNRSADGDFPNLDAEYREAADAEDALDRARFKTAIRTIVKNSLRVLQDEGRLVPEVSERSQPGLSSASPDQRDPERGGSTGSSAA